MYEIFSESGMWEDQERAWDKHCGLTKMQQMFPTPKCHRFGVIAVVPQLGRCLHKSTPITWNPAVRQCRKTTSGRAGFPSAWLGPIPSLIRNWLVYWSIPPVISHSSQLPIPPLVLIIGQPLWSVFCLSTPTPPPHSAHSAMGGDVCLTYSLQRGLG